MNQRRAGLLLPVSALPSRYGVGDFGPAARSWIAFLGAAHQRVWQILPLTVADGFGCPYASPTGFATDPCYLSPDDLLEEGLIQTGQLPPEHTGSVDWGQMRASRQGFLKAAGRALAETADLEAYCTAQPWALPWARFQTMEHSQWWMWSTSPQAGLEEPAIAEAIAIQWGLDKQWARLRRLARAHDVQIWGDLPFFVGLQSADVWTHPELFDLRPDGMPRTVTGVPPDAFAPDGQRWGHPHLRRDAHVDQGWRWAISRAERALSQVDVLRLDHFRGFHEVWEVPAEHETAAGGRWIEGPGKSLLDRLMSLAGPGRWVAEDLGVISPPVRALRDQAGLRGMAVLQFAFGEGSEAPFRPHAHHPDQVVYTGTHDNSTLVQWVNTAAPSALDHARRYFDCDRASLSTTLQRAAWRSVANTAILPLQDVLGLGAQARFNLPGTTDGNWCWRNRRAVLTPTLASRLAEQAILSARGPARG